MRKYFYEIYEALPRQGPGTEEATRRALASLAQLPGETRVLDVGCGAGAQTLVLARGLTGVITAVDNHVPFLRTLAQRAADNGFGHRIHTQMESMFELPFGDASFDLVWAEGSIYVVGFAEGLRAWRRLLASGGYLVASEAVWRSPDPPAPVVEFWNEEYPALTDVTANLTTAVRCGYEVVTHFPLAREGWWENYYVPMERQVSELRRRYAQDTEAQQVADIFGREIEMFDLYGEHYGYEFFVLQKPRTPSPP